MEFIAEIGMNHNGNFDLAYELIKQAKMAGADVAKFQLGWRDSPGEINQIDEKTLKQLKSWCDYFDIEFLVSIITPQAFELAKTIELKRYKVASRTVRDDLNLVEQILRDGKETIISLGMWEDTKPPFPECDQIKYLWCKSKYPCFASDLVSLPSNFEQTIYEGYSDHSIGIEIPILAISRGAKTIEKHFTLEKTNPTIRDHLLSATPDEFAMLVQVGRNIRRAIEAGM